MANHQIKLSISDWISFLSAEKNSNTSNILSLAAFVIAALALISVSSSNSILHIVCLVVGAGGLFFFWQRLIKVFGPRAKKATKLLDDIMSGKEMDVLKIEDEWKEFLKTEKSPLKLSFRCRPSVKRDAKIDTKRDTGKLLFIFVFLVAGIILLVLNRDGIDSSSKMKWGIAVGLVVGSIPYFFNCIFAKAHLMWEERLKAFYFIFLFIASFIVLYMFVRSDGNEKLLGFGTCLTAGGMMYLATYIDALKKNWKWIFCALLIFFVIIVAVEMAIT